MKKLLTSSAMFISVLAIIGLVILGLKEHDVAAYIAMVAIGAAGARSYEGTKTK